GGGALYMDEGQFGFELVFHRKTLEIAALNDLAEAICDAAARGLQNLGVNAPREKLAKRALDSADRRVVTLRELLGEATPSLPQIKLALLDGFMDKLGIAACEGEITEREEALAQQVFQEEIGADDFVAEIDDPAAETGTLTASVTGRGG